MSVSKILLSIIVPVYNVESFVAICLQSILNSTDNPTDFELIIVNDGTLDNSMSIAKEIVSVHRNVQILEQENQGLSVARMNGLKMAQGEYIWFVDSDDWLEPGAINKVLTLIRGIHPDVIVTPLTWRFANSNLDFRDIDISNDKMYQGREFLANAFMPVGAAQRFILKRLLFDKNEWLFFPPHLLHEDEYFGRILLYFVEKTYVLSVSLYNYRQRNNSIMGTFSDRNVRDLIKIYELLNTFCLNAVQEEDRLWFRRNIFQNVLISNHYRRHNNSGQKGFSKYIFRHSLYFITEYFKTKPHGLSKITGDIVFILFPIFFVKYKGFRYLRWS